MLRRDDQRFALENGIGNQRLRRQSFLRAEWPREMTEPFPSSLSTQMLPPISSVSLRLMARPSPVPPYLRVVEASTWEKD